MDCLLIGGAPSTGKSESIYRLTNYLLRNGYQDITNSVPPTFKDFRAILEGNNQNGQKIRIIINTPTDTVKIINHFKTFYDNNGSYDILISSIRDDNFWPRQDFFKIMDINKTGNFILEMPLAKITRRGNSYTTAQRWYQDKTDEIVLHTLRNVPFII